MHCLMSLYLYSAMSIHLSFPGHHLKTNLSGIMLLFTIIHFPLCNQKATMAQNPDIDQKPMLSISFSCILSR